MNITGTVTSLMRSVGHLFLPTLCEHCHMQLGPQEQVLCTMCETLLPETNFHAIRDNEAAKLFYGRMPIENATSLVYFADGGIVQNLLHGLKYDYRTETGTWLGYQLGRRIHKSSWGAAIDYIVPVPLHPAKEAQRGYNQSLLIATGISSAINKVVRPDLLSRKRKTESQVNKSRVERVENMAGAFFAGDCRDIFGKHILLCDDVLTTGATLEACAIALQQKADVKISIATIAIAVA